MKYSLAVNYKTYSNDNLQPKYKLIDLSNLTNLDTSSIEGISKYTSTFENEKEFKQTLLDNKLITKNDLIYPLTICYKYNNELKNVCFKFNDESVLLFKDDFHLFNSKNITNELKKLIIDNPNFDYNNCSQKSRISLLLLKLIAKEVLHNSYYEHCNAAGYAHNIINYVNDIRVNNYVNTSTINDDIESLIRHISYNKTKNNEQKLDIRKLYEIIIFYNSTKNKLFQNLNTLDKEKNSNKNSQENINEQITITELMNSYDKDVQEESSKEKNTEEQITIFDVMKR